MKRKTKETSLSQHKLVKTTTFLALLIVASMLFSSMGTAMYAKKAEATPTMAHALKTPTSFVASQLTTPGAPSTVAGRDTVWDNGGDDGTGYAFSSQLDDLYPFNSQLADDFQFDTSMHLDGMHFVGQFWNTYYYQNPAEFNVIFYADDGSGNQPTGAGMSDPTPTALAVYNFPSVTGVYNSYGRFEYDVTFASTFDCDAGAKYWVAVQWVGEFAYYGQWGWVTNGYNADLLHVPMQGFPLIGISYWTTPGYGDQAFTLSGFSGPLPPDDVKIVSINSPSSGPGAVITPQATIKNSGTNDETFTAEFKIGQPTAPVTLLNYGFDNYVPPSLPFPPAGWTIINGGGTNTWYQSSSAAHAGTYCAQISYYYPQNDDWLVTKHVTGATGGTFSFWYKQYSSSWPEHFQVYKSTSGNTQADFTGGSGTMLADINNIGDTNWHQYTYTESASSVWYAVRCISPDEFYLYVDDYHLPDGTTESFEATSSTPGYWPDWTSYTIVGTAKWDASTAGSYPTCAPHSAPYMAYFNSFSYSTGYEALLIKNAPLNFQAAGLQTYTLKFWMYHDTGYSGNADQVGVYASTNGATFYPVGTVNRYDGTTGWSQATMDMSSYASESTVWIGFLGVSAYGNNMFIDDVSVVASGMSYEYDQSVPVTLAAGASTQVSFPDWTPAAYQVVENTAITYTAVCTAPLPGDATPDNNMMAKQFTLTYPFLHDIQADAILSPTTNGNAQTLPVKMQISNQGQFPEREFFVDMQIGRLYGNYINEDFSNGVPPYGWTSDIANWQVSQSANAGGVAPEAVLNWYPSSVGTFRLKTNVLNTVGETAMTLSFRHYVNDYDGGYTLAVQTSTDGTNWQTVWSMAGTYTPATQVFIPLTTANGLGSPTLQVAWVFSGDLFDLNYWYIDDCHMTNPSYVAEYDEAAAVAAWIQPGQTMQLDFPAWTPANLVSPQDSGTFDFTAVGTSQLPIDSNPANDVATSAFKLTFTHDVGVKKITSPAQGKDDIYLHFDDGTNVDSLGLTSGGTFEAAVRFTPTELGAYAGSAIDALHVHYGYGGKGVTATGNVKIYDQGSSTTPGDLLYSQAFTPPGASGWFDITLNTPVSIDGSKDMWVSIEWTHNAGEYPAGCDGGPYVAGKGDWLGLGGSWVEASVYGFNLNWNIWAHLGGGGGPGGASVYVKTGTTSPIAAIVNNAGTFIQNGLTADATILSYVTDPNGTVVYTDSIGNINLNPGAEQTCNYQTYTFAAEGIYGLTVSIPLGNDDKPSNNVKTIFIGADGTAPTTTYTLNPTAPDGANGWYVSNVVVTLKATDAMSGVGQIYYKLDGGAAIPYTGPFTISTDGNHTVAYYATDKVGNTETEKSVIIHVDKTVPMNTLNKDILINKIKYTANVQDNTSGMDRVEFWIGPYLQFTQTISDPSGPQTAVWILSPVPNINVTIEARAFDLAGNHISSYAGALDLALPGQLHVAQAQTTKQ